MATLTDSIERQFDHAETVDDRIRLMKAYTDAAANVFVRALVAFSLMVEIPILIALGLLAYSITKLSPLTLSLAIASGTVTGGGAMIARFWFTRNNQRSSDIDRRQDETHEDLPAQEGS